MTAREPAWRVFAQELLSCLEQEKGAGDRAASYLLGPFGLRANRVLLAGTVTKAESVGRSETTQFLRSRLTDPTGTVPVTASGFTPRSLSQLQRVEEAGPTLAVGKTSLFRGRDGVVYPSVRLEALASISEEEMRRLWGEILHDSTERAHLMTVARGTPLPTRTALLDLGIPSIWVDGALASREKYPSASPSEFSAVLLAALRALRGIESATRSAPVRIVRDVGSTMDHSISAVEGTRAKVFLELVDDLSETSLDGYADLRALLERASSRGIPTHEAESLLTGLEQSGALEEPIVGKLRRP